MPNPPDPDRAADWALVARAQGGDREAFAELYRTHHTRVYRYVWSRLQQHELAEDLAADVFVRALANLNRIADTGHAFGAWLITIARNLVYDHCKAGARREHVVYDIPDVLVPGQRVATDAVDAAVTLNGCMAGLSDRHRAVLRDRFVHGLGPGEIAARDGRSVGAVKAEQCRAVARLREHVTAGGAR